jgi:hypothetical protein
MNSHRMELHSSSEEATNRCRAELSILKQCFGIPFACSFSTLQEVLEHFRFNHSIVLAWSAQVPLNDILHQQNICCFCNERYNLWHDAAVSIHARRSEHQLLEKPRFEHLAVKEADLRSRAEQENISSWTSCLLCSHLFGRQQFKYRAKQPSPASHTAKASRSTRPGNRRGTPMYDFDGLSDCK